jgi:thiosulfate dehydrogenase [quinone] large subunit
MKQHTLDSHDAWAGMLRAQSSLQRPGLWLSGVQLVLAFEWLISSLNKLLAPNFDAGLLAVLQGSTHTNPYTWYSAILQRIVIPNHSLFAFATPLGEMAIGLTLTAGAVFWLLRFPPRATMFGAGMVCAALLGSAFLSLNYFFQGGTTLPWVNTSNAFTEGVDIDILIPLLSLVLLAAYVHILYTARSAALEATAAGPSPEQSLVSVRQTAFTLHGQMQRSTLKSMLGDRVNETERWVDVQGVYWTARELLERSPLDLLTQRVTSVSMSLDAAGHGRLQALDATDEFPDPEGVLPSFDLIRLRYQNGMLGPVMFVVAGESHDPRLGVMALTGPMGEFLDLRPPRASDVPEWPLPDDAHAVFFAADRVESPERGRR